MPTFPEKAVEAMRTRMMSGEAFSTGDLIAIARAEGVPYVRAAGKVGNLIQIACAAEEIEGIGDRESGFRWRAKPHTSR